MKRYFFCIFSFLLFFNTILVAQEVVWQKKMLQSSWTTGYSIKQTTDGNYIVCGIYDRFYGFTAKLNPQGDTIWVTISPENLYSIVEANDGNYVAIGWSSITKISQNGELLWYKSISENGGDLFFNQITKISDGNFVVVGKFELANPRINCAYVAKFNNNGEKIWRKIHGQNNYNQELLHIKEIDDGNFIATGGLDLGGNIEVLLMKLNHKGDIIWERNYGTNYTDFANSVFQLPDNGFLTIGTIWFNNFYMKLLFTKSDSSGNYIWSKIYGDTNTHFTFNSSDCAVEDKNNNSYVITGQKDSLSFLLAIDQNAEKKWEKTYGLDTLYISGYSVDLCNDSGYVVCGYVFYYPFNRSDPQYLYALKTTKPKPIGILNEINNTPKSFELKQNFPNPFNNKTILKYVVNKSSMIKIEIFNILGMKIQTLINKNCEPGMYKIVFDSIDYSSGIYFVQLSDNLGNKDVRKMIIIK